MKLDRLPEYFITVIVLVLGLGLALYIGSQVGTGNTRTLVLIAGGLGFTIAGVALKRHVWMLIPVFFYTDGRIMGTPLALWQVATIIAFGWWVIFVTVKKVRVRAKLEIIDYLLFLNIAFIILTFLRHPVGTLAMSTDRIGGAPYYAIMFACMGYWVLCRVDMDSKYARQLPWLMVLGMLPFVMARAIAFLIPPLAPLMGFAILGVGVDNNLRKDSAVDAFDTSVEDAGRLTNVTGPLRALMGALVARYPVESFINPLYFGRCLIMATSVVLIMLSGFRSALAYAILQFWVIGCYKKSFKKLILITLIIAPILGLVVLAQGTIIRLPYAVQRILSSLPAKWDEEPVYSAETSAEWRFDMWEMMMSDSSLLENRWLGDGFGYSIRAFIDANYAQIAGSREAEHEAFILKGELHSGPFSTIRATGYVGLALFYLLSFGAIVVAHRLIKRSRNTPFFFPSLVIATGPLIQTIQFTLVYGYYPKDLPMLILYIGLIKLLDNGLILYRIRKKREDDAFEKGKAFLTDTLLQESPEAAQG